MKPLLHLHKHFSRLLSVLLLMLLLGVCPVPQAHAVLYGSSATDPTGSVQIYLANRRAICTGSLINPGWVMTAQHCITDIGSIPATTEVFLGALGLDQGERHTVSNIYLNQTNDVALLQLTTRTSQIDMVVPYGINDPVMGSPATISGWGATQANRNRPASTLQISQNVVSQVSQNSDTMQLSSTDGSQTQGGDSGAGVFIFGLVCGVHARTSVLNSTSVKTSAVAAWIFQTAHIYPGGTCNLDQTKKKKAGLAQRIMAMGSSETTGYEKNNGYRAALNNFLTKMKLTSNFVGPDQAGIPPTDHLAGSPSDLIRDNENEAKCAVYNYAPDIVTLETGEEDIAYFQDVSNAPSRLDSLISTIQQVSPQTIILVAPIAPSTVPEYQSLIEQYDSSVKSIVLARKNAGQHVDFVDTGDLVATNDEDGYSHENGPVEMRPSGFFKVAAAFNLAIDNAVNAGWIPDSLPLYNGPCNGAGGGGKRSIVSLRVMPIGDSITAGYENGTWGNGFRGPLQQDIQNLGQTIQFVGDESDGSMTNPQNEGFSGMEIAYIASQAVPAAASWRPNVATILAGTNDVASFDDIAGAPGRLDSMIGGVFQSAPDATLLVAGIPPSVDNTFNANLQAFNNSVRSLVSNRQNSGQHIEYVDMSNLDPTTVDKADPWHPNDAGYKVMGDNFSNAIEDVMNKGWVTDPVAINRTVGGGGRHGNGTPGPPPGPGNWQPQSEVANGGGAALGSFVQMADINGDGRPDYLVIDKSGVVTAYLNAGPNPNGGWVWLLQPWALTNGSGAPGSQTRFADINGDGRADFLSIADDGSVSGYLNGGPKPDGTGWVWLKQPTIANGVGAPGSQIQFADINGDGRADYLNVSPNGAVTAYFNGGPAADGSGWTWPVMIQIANGVNAPYGSQVQFADINGDGFDDYLVTSSIDGTVTAWMNGGQISSTEWNLYSVGQVAPGIGAPSLDLRVVFADINGDGKADYLAVNRNTAAVSAFLNNGLDTSPVQGWLPLGQIAAGLGGPNIDIQMADIDGDGRADYIAVNTLTGSASGYLNGGQKTGGWIWFPQPKIASGVGAAAGSTYRFADVNGDGKADYLVVGFMNSVDAYLSVGPGPDGWIWSSKHPLYPGSSNWANIGAAAAVHFADMDGDGFADFLVYFNGNVVGSINTQQFSDSSPDTFLDSMDQPYDHAFAYSPGAGSNITLANIDIGDPKRADYLAIGDGGSVTALLNQGVAQAPGTHGSYINWKSVGQIAAGTAPAGTSVLFADINGDGRADYLVVDNNTGAINAWLNNGAGMNQ